MAWKRHFVTALVLIGASYSFAAVPVTVEVLEVKKIWDQAPHNAFTDLVRWNEAFYCAFREGRGHVSTDGKIRILQSKDAEQWESRALISLAGYDLRDAHLSVTPDGKVFAPRLMLVGGAAPRKQDSQSAPTGTFVSFGTFWKGGAHWSKPQIVVEPGRWMWQVSWHKGRAYGVSYTAGKGNKRYLDLLVSDDGIHYEPHVSRLFERGYPTEATLRFDSDQTCYVLVRRDRRGDDPSSALLGVSQPDYKQWQWKDLGADFNGFGGPNFIRISDTCWIAAGRMHAGGAHTALTYLDVEKGIMTKLIKLPSGGDTSYPGLVWHNDVLYVSYYSSHEGKTSIYLAKLKVRPTTLRKITGVVRDKEGKPISDAIVLTRLDMAESTITNTAGRFTLLCKPINTLRPREDTVYLIIRHKERNLAAIVELNDNTKTLDIEMAPGVIFSGKAVDIQGNGIPNASLFVTFRVSHFGIGSREATDIDVQGNYEIRAVPSGYLFSVSASAKGYGEQYVQAHTAEAADGRIELEPLILPTANLSVSGVVVDPDHKPVAGAKVSCYGEGQPSQRTQTDAGGRFTLKDVCTGRIVILTRKNGQVRLRGRDETTGGATDVRIVMQEIDASGRPVPKEPPSLMGKLLPPLEDFNLELNANQIKGKKVLVCFWDMQQRPSRRHITQLAQQYVEWLKEKGVVIITVQASKVDQEKLNVWIKNNDLLFPVGMTQGDEKEIRFKWGIRSLPWLILTDRDHIVKGEGLSFEQLEEQISQTVGTK